ncbi:hypothetical protein F5H01DRAFT_353706 [Linnemannia elongata]|nr:hypothetical protein F5H01DRAFT_353706 [Linnemannia elongata]
MRSILPHLLYMLSICQFVMCSAPVYTGTITTHGMGNNVDCQVRPCSGCRVVDTFHPGDKVAVTCKTSINMGSWTAQHYKLISDCWVGYGNVDGVDAADIPECV